MWATTLASETSAISTWTGHLHSGWEVPESMTSASGRWSPPWILSPSTSSANAREPRAERLGRIWYGRHVTRIWRQQTWIAKADSVEWRPILHTVRNILQYSKVLSIVELMIYRCFAYALAFDNAWQTPSTQPRSQAMSALPQRSTPWMTLGIVARWK